MRAAECGRANAANKGLRDKAPVGWATSEKGPATLSAEPPWITPGKIEFQGRGRVGRRR